MYITTDEMPVVFDYGLSAQLCLADVEIPSFFVLIVMCEMVYRV